jgi:hypothetical protein
MIDYLQAGKAANFHRLKARLTNAAIDELFRGVRAAQPSPSQYLFVHRRERRGRSVWSAAAFTYERPASFLSEQSGIMERVCGFLLLVEHQGHIAIFKSGLTLPSSFATRFLARIPADRIDAAVAKTDSIFTKIGLRNMSAVSKLVMRRKTLEAPNLRLAVGPAASSRYAPQAYSVRDGVEHYSATPSTGRITQRSDRAGHLELIRFAEAEIDEFVNGTAAPSDFIHTFGREVSLETIAETNHPVAFSVDVAALTDALFDEQTIRLVREEDDGYRALDKVEIDLLLAECGSVLEVEDDGSHFKLVDSNNAEQTGRIALNKSRIALRELSFPLIAEVEVELTQFPLGADPDRRSLRRYIDQEDFFIVLFDDVRLAYLEGRLFRDAGMAAGAAELLSHIRVDPGLTAVSDEKGTFVAGQTAFDDSSTFGVVVATAAAGDSILICDDLGDEWADFIGLNSANDPPRISFYHAKHDELSLGASGFHVSVSQAIKNLGRMGLSPDEVARKAASWNGLYISGTGVQTAIPRIIRGVAASLESDIANVGLSPDVIKRACIVTSSLSRAAVEAELNKIAASNRPSPHFVQLYWLLMSFFSACAELNTFGCVICCP